MVLSLTYKQHYYEFLLVLAQIECSYNIRTEHTYSKTEPGL